MRRGICHSRVSGSLWIWIPPDIVGTGMTTQAWWESHSEGRIYIYQCQMKPLRTCSATLLLTCPPCFCQRHHFVTGRSTLLLTISTTHRLTDSSTHRLIDSFAHWLIGSSAPLLICSSTHRL
jgi:hypothetical protein